MPSVDIVIPVYNEGGLSPRTGRRLAAVMDSIPEFDCCVLLVENGSVYSSSAMIQALHRADARFHEIQLIRNFGTEGASLPAAIAPLQTWLSRCRRTLRIRPS